MSNKISIIIPCFNEKKTIKEIVRRILEQNIENFEIIIVDDCSSDGTREELKVLQNQHFIRIVYKDRNEGKGSAIADGLKLSDGEIIIFQDADLEYNPRDYKKLIYPIIKEDADIVYGSRFLGGGDFVRLHFFWHYLANKILTFISNVFTNLNMSDMETGYKAFKTSVIKSIKLEEKSFGIEPEITVKLAKKLFKFYEVSISYNGRSYEDGKKIRLKDAFIAIYCLFKYRFFR
jgi:glycosyltransferase involved in cell wall biosynthesis